MSKDPAFLFYSKDWITGTAEMLPEEKGIYIDFLAYQHQNTSLPNDPQRLAKIAGISLDHFNKIWPSISSKFIAKGDRLVNLKLSELMDDRKEKGHKNTISGTFASILRKYDLNKTEYKQVKAEFKISDFTDIPKESLTESLTEWLCNRLKSIGNGNTYILTNTSIKIKVEDFYNNELKKNKDKQGYADYEKLVKLLFGEIGDKGRIDPALALPEQITFENFIELLGIYNSKPRKKKFSDLLFDMKNKPSSVKGNTSLYLTLRKWLQMEFN